MIHELAFKLILAAIVFVMALAGIQLRSIARRWVDSGEKMAIARTSVLYVQQLYYELAGPEKMQRALETARELLEAKGIDFSAEEMTVLMEAAIAEFKEAFFKPETALTGIAVYPDEDPDSETTSDNV